MWMLRVRMIYMRKTSYFIDAHALSCIIIPGIYCICYPISYLIKDCVRKPILHPPARFVRLKLDLMPVAGFYASG